MNIIIVEDNRLLLENLKLLLSGEPGITVTGAFETAEDALKALKGSHPDVLLVDLGLPGMSGIDFIRRVKRETPSIDIMAHTIFEDKENVFSAIKAGASGYILKGSSPREIIEALNGLYQGGAPMSPKIARKVIVEFQDEGANEEYCLTQREKAIVKGIEEGLVYKEIGDKLHISPLTVRVHVRNIYEKLQAKSKQEALMKARKKGII
ncbi:MAG TPA: response regulator transcription factor [Thermodesulfovibrionales bacterium]|nr:response regulator transcription factor [Thermodesulfovibrionales bacterium]